MESKLPRVTYSNTTADFSGVHAVLDQRIEAVTQALGKFHPNDIGGRACDDGQRYEARSPIDHRLALGSFIRTGRAGVDAAVQAARLAAETWAKTPWQGRVATLRTVAKEVEREKYDLAATCLLEVGKSRMEAMGEVEEAIDLIGYYCDEMEANAGYVRPLRRAFEQESTLDVLRPIGVFGVIVPFNFPVALAIGMLTGALLGGNTIVFKPSPLAGLTGSWIARLFRQGGIPDGVLNLVCGDADTGQDMLDHPGIDGFAFIGSHSVGMHILRSVAAGRYNRPVIAEMGGKNPTYVTHHADLGVAAEGVMRSAFGLQGQKCSSGSKVYVQHDVFDEFMQLLCDKSRSLRIGDPSDRQVFMGPLINDAAGARFARACEDARRDGAIVLGGERLAGGVFDRGVYVQPTVVAGLPASHWLNKEEIFLPFLSVQAFDGLDAAIRDGNDIDYGLTAGIYTRDAKELDYFLSHAQAGALYANRASGATTGAWPGVQTFCGWKGSGTTGKGGLGPYYVPQFMREQSHTLMNA